MDLTLFVISCVLGANEAFWNIFGQIFDRLNKSNKKKFHLNKLDQFNDKNILKVR